MAIIITASFCCVFAATISSSRMLFSFARDGGLPKFFYYTDPRSKLPLRTVWLSCGVAMVLAFAGIGSTVALLAFASVGTIALKTANVIPVFIRLTVGKDAFKPNEFHYGKWSIVIGWIAVFEVAFLFVMLCMPQFYPVTSLNLNYTPIMIVAVIAYASLSWIFSARKWFKGPIQHVSDEELEAMEIDAKTAVGGAIRSPEGGSVIAVDSEATSVAVTEQTV